MTSHCNTSALFLGLNLVEKGKSKVKVTIDRLIQYSRFSLNTCLTFYGKEGDTTLSDSDCRYNHASGRAGLFQRFWNIIKGFQSRQQPDVVIQVLMRLFLSAVKRKSDDIQLNNASKAFHACYPFSLLELWGHGQLWFQKCLYE